LSIYDFAEVRSANCQVGKLELVALVLGFAGQNSSESIGPTIVQALVVKGEVT
jgi:hypothetical protein